MTMRPLMRFAVSISALAAVSLVAACGGSSGGDEGSDEQGPIDVGFVVPQTGAISVLSPPAIEVAKLAVEEINSAGGIGGRDLRMQIFDDASDTDGGLKAYTNMVHKAGVDAIIALENSDSRNAGVPIAEKAGTPVIYAVTYEGGACAENLFIDGETPEQFVQPVIDVAGKRGVKSWFIIGSDIAYGRGQVEAAKRYIDEAGGSVVKEETLPLDVTDWGPVLSSIKAADPDAVFFAYLGGTPNVGFHKQYVDSGLTAPIYSVSLDEATATAVGKAAEGVTYAGSYFTGLENKANKDFLAALERKFGADHQTPSSISVPTYDAFHLYAAAVEKAGSADAEDVLAALPEVSFDGPRGKVQMSEQHHAVLPIYVAEVQGDGGTEVVEEFGAVDPGEQCPDL
jgi:urea transport system substrate-binding protein